MSLSCREEHVKVGMQGGVGALGQPFLWVVPSGVRAQHEARQGCCQSPAPLCPPLPLVCMPGSGLGWWRPQDSVGNACFETPTSQKKTSEG